MRIENLKYSCSYDLVCNLYKVTLLQDPSFKIYQDAYISIETINTDCIAPTQYYVLNEELQSKLELKYELIKWRKDLFDIRGYLEFNVQGEAINRTLLPPIVEESIERDGSIIHLLNDGMHRVYLARMEGRNITVAYIRGVPKNYPYYAYPIKGGWDAVEKIDSLQEGYIKKWHRIENNKKLYRNFDSVFSNCSKPRMSS